MDENREKQQAISDLTRRSFFKSGALAGGSWWLAKTNDQASFDLREPGPLARQKNESDKLPDLRPARWIWYPSERCLANTVVLFRREIELSAQPKRARGWVIGSSRYHLFANDRRIQFGPAPSDPRFEEVDPLDLTGALQPGRNTIGAQVLYYGHGDGTWPLGKPGFLFWLEIETEDGRKQQVVSDPSWQTHVARSWKPGQFKRWYLRAFQEEFDARLYPSGWAGIDFRPNDDWLSAMPLDCPVDKPPIASGYRDYALDVRAIAANTELRPRSIPLMREGLVPVKQLTESLSLEWRRPPEEYFECLTPNSFKVDRAPSAKKIGENAWRVDVDSPRAAILTFELNEQIAGWPYFTVEAPAGTVIELLVHEAHLPGGPALINSHFHSWTRFICREGVNRFETFDFECCRWIQLHIRNTRGAVTVRDVGMRRRRFPWPNEPQVNCSDPAIQKLINASINTLHNSSQETIVDGMGRERQQYSGDGGHQIHAIYFTFGERRLPARFIRTYSQGMTQDGYFLDCWPAYDRLARLMERQLQFTEWGPLLDHGVGFNFDCWYYYLHTGDLVPLTEAYPRLLKFADYLKRIQTRDGLLPVEGLGVPTVWMDHQAYRRQRHKQCSFNLYAAAGMEHALATLCEAMGDEQNKHAAKNFGEVLRSAAVKHFWDAERELFIVNRPWLGEEGEARMCDRSLATAVLFDQCPNQRTRSAVEALAEAPSTMGVSYPANAGWRYWALAKGGRTDVALNDLRRRWATMLSVNLNNTIQEDWRALPDSSAQWSHCAVVPLYFLFMSVAGIRPLAPGFTRCEIRPQLGDLESLDLVAHTVRGPIKFSSEGKPGDRRLSITMPEGCEGELVLLSEKSISLEPLSPSSYRLTAGKTTALRLTRE
jgi:hypothetical protein